MPYPNTKTIYVGSFYEFTDLGIDEFTCNFRDSHDDPDRAPFLSYDRDLRCFVAEVDKDDDETLANLCTRLEGAIEASSKMSLYDEIRCKPIDGIWVDVGMNNSEPDGGDLIDHLDEAEDDEIGNSHNVPDSIAHLTSYWKPRGGDITILPQILASQLTEHTNCQLFSEVETKRCRILGANHALAKDMLQNIEPLLEVFKAQQNTTSIPANGNILILPPTGSTTILQYPRITAPHPAFKRVITHVHDHDALPTKALGEVRQYDHQGNYVTPDNLLTIGISPTNTIRSSRVWDDYIYQTFGDRNNLHPRLTQPPPSSISSTGILHNQTQVRIAAWTDEVVMGADPDVPPPTPKEPVVLPRRRVIAEADSESDTESEPQAETKNQSTIPQSQGQSPSECLLTSPSSPLPSADFSPAIPGAGIIITPSILPASTTYQSVDVEPDVGFEIPEDFGLLSSPFNPTPDPIEHGTTSKLGNYSADQGVQTLIQLDAESPEPPSYPRGRGYNAKQGRSTTQRGASTAQRGGHRGGSTASRGAHGGGFGFQRGGSASQRGSQKGGSPGKRGDPATQRGGFTTQRGAQKGGSPGKKGGSTAPQGQRGGSVSHRGRSAPRGPVSYATALSHGHKQLSTSDILPTGSVNPGPRDSQARESPLSHTATSTTEVSLFDLSQSPEDQVPGQDTNYRPTLLPAVPPGFENSNHSRTFGVVTQRDGTQDLSTRLGSTSIHSASGSSATNSATSNGVRSLRFSEQGANYSQPNLPQKNIHMLREQRVRELQQDQNKKAPDTPPQMLRSTMNQQAGKPKKGHQRGDSNHSQMKPTTEKPTAKPESDPSRAAGNNAMSAAKLAQIRKNPLLAELHADTLEARLREEQCRKLIPQLERLFEISRAFNGELSFQAQLGQVLVTYGSMLSSEKLIDPEMWSKMFAPQQSGNNMVQSSFTPILTTNGADVDRALEMKMLDGKSKIKAFGAKPISYSVSYRFSCQSRSNDDFWIVVDQNGNYELVREAVTTGMVNVHCPNHIWDASFVLSGHLKWLNPPPALQNSISAFVESLYVLPGREKFMMVFRQPSDHEMEIRNMVVKRTSKHGCNMPKCNMLQLQVTETKTLLFKKHPEDLNLWQAYESTTDDHQRLMDTGRVHYEISVIHSDISKALAQNVDLQFGRLTDEQTTGKSLVKSHRDSICSMLDIVVRMVSKLDFMGLSNIGTQQRNTAAEAAHRLKLTQAAASRGGPPAPRSMPVQTKDSSSLAHDDHGPAAIEVVPGIRTNTRAEIFSNPDGSKYRLGLGGAKIPVFTNQDMSAFSNTEDSMAPDDSVSQVGGAYRKPQNPGIHATPSVVTDIGPSRQLSSVNNQTSDKDEPTFW
ncbi:hypothetical protein PV10_07181 [Exophiala mesophila]|uniref:Uncharacterized protein n=1 Tax=Exophiala mesophila TaxID=212818 RepID=A0A0D1Z7A4_EXOME|nr:uncharacterized protein PV10_07181 [Exophiala mesophila]KIV89809.1 hypothetical protein PV10_07181 [Exophiala mesophila]